MPILQRHLDGHSLASRISPGACPIRFRRGGFGRTRFHAHYDPWQRAASTQAIELDRQVHFDLLHHSGHFTGSLAWLGIADSPAFLVSRNHGCAERWIRTLKDQHLWTTLHDTTDELRQAVASFVDRYNSSWLIQRHGHRTPKEAYQAAQSAPGGMTG